MQKTLLLFLVSFSITAQIKGVVKDSISGKPIPYVSIWIQNENIGITSEENGEFTISSTEKNKNLIFSALGFEKKIIRASKAISVIDNALETVNKARSYMGAMQNRLNSTINNLALNDKI